MSAGLTFTKADLDNRMATIVLGLRSNLRLASEMNALLNNTTRVPNDAFLTGLGYSAGEVTMLRASFTDLGGTGASLYRLATGAATLGGVNNFFFNADQLTGVITS